MSELARQKQPLRTLALHAGVIALPSAVAFVAAQMFMRPGSLRQSDFFEAAGVVFVLTAFAAIVACAAGYLVTRRAASPEKPIFTGISPAHEFVPAQADVPATAVSDSARLAEVEAKCVELSRSLSVARDQLQHTRTQAEASARVKDAFLMHMSHEVRTPMTTILGNVSMLDEPDITPRQRANLLRNIRVSSDHLLGLINDLLDLSQIESGTVVIQPQKLSPIAAFEEAVSLMRPRAIAKGIALNAEASHPLPREIEVDPLRLRQILLNLIANAIRFTDSGGVRVSLSCEMADPACPSIRFDIADTGAGIDPIRLSDLFKPFAATGIRPADSAGGAGVGLAISHRLASLMKCRLDVSSTPGVGSIFSLVIPITAAQARAVTSASDRAVDHMPLEHTPFELEHARILYCEDGVDNQRLVQFILSKAGATVTVAENGRAGLDVYLAAQASPTPFDLVLMDMQMPEMDGYSAAEELRRRGSNVPIIALTAHALTGDRERCLAAGCDDYATKPLDRLGLIAVCAAWRTRKSVKGASSPECSDSARAA